MHGLRAVTHSATSSSTSVAEHFSDPARVAGMPEAWDLVLRDHADVRTRLVRGLRLDPGQRLVTGGKEMYMESEQDEEVARCQAGGEVVPHVHVR